MGTKPISHTMDKTQVGAGSLVADLRALMEDTATADVIFLIGPKKTEFYAHRLILNARCSLLRALEADATRTLTARTGCTVTLPDLSPESFRDTLIYIYTDKVYFEDSTVFGLMSVACQLGVHNLSNRCVTHILSTLSADNVCAFYSAANSLERMHPEREPNEPGLLSMFTAFIEENAEVCVRTDGWVRLAESDIIALISSENFSLGEEDVWRAILAWAKYRSNLASDSQPSDWSSSEKDAIRQNLSVVIHYVKILLIDSRVFAEEVEPTGAVPIELSLERYRLAAIPESCSQGVDVRLCPRASNKLFLDTALLTKENQHHQRLLNSWYGDLKQTWRLLYRASQDGFTAEDFHRHCDGHAPTFTIIAGSTGNLCGGYSDVAWTSNTPPRGRFYPSNRAFLFTLCNQQGVGPTKYDVINPKFATLHHPRNGPMFGAGADLCIANGCDAGMQCYSNLPHTYDGQCASPSILMGDYNFNIDDYEVFTTQDTTTST